MNPDLDNNKLIIYQPEEGISTLEVKLEKETVWLSLDQITNLFERNKSTISRHIKNIFLEKELVRNSVVAFFATTASDGKTYSVEYFNLDVIISVGYRVKSKRGTQFRIWANKVLKNHLLHQHTLNYRMEKIEKNVKTTIYTDKLPDKLKLDLEKHNAQYEPIEMKLFKKSHDRFLIVDNKTVYHIGASLKDLGKKLFGFSKISINPEIILDYLEKQN